MGFFMAQNVRRIRDGTPITSLPSPSLVTPTNKLRLEFSRSASRACGTDTPKLRLGSETIVGSLGIGFLLMAGLYDIFTNQNCINR